MGKTKIHELAKELNITSKELLEKAKELGIDAKSHMSSIEEDEANKLKAQYSNKNKADKSKTEKAVKKEDKKQSPVIIRREVINTDIEKEESKKQNQDSKSKNVGFVERNKNADYNIVYRNKPTKPMTVSELFGLGKKEEPKKEENKK